MKQLLWRIPVRATVVALLIVMLAVSVALALTLVNVDGIWLNARTSGGGAPTNVNYNNTPNITDENQVFYGISTGSGQSGFGFDGNNGGFAITPGQVFLLGKFTHYNRPITASAVMEYVDLAVKLDLADPTASQTFNFTVELDETPNSYPCAYGATNGPCDDRVILPTSIPDQGVTIDGVPYTLQITGFIPSGAGACPATPSASPNSVYVTAENRENYACMYGRIVLPIDFGDAPNYDGQTLLPDGARHNITATGPYLGVLRGDGEVDGQPNATATGDDLADSDDEDGFVSMDTNWGDGSGFVVVSVNRGTAGNRACVYGWVDWGNDGFDVGNNDSFAQGSVTSSGNLTLTFTDKLPARGHFPPTAYLRLRVMSATGSCPTLGPKGLAHDGEVEDYRLSFMPAAVNLASFTAAAAAEGVTLAWETVSEMDNAGFNVYRSESAAGPWMQVNAALIPAAAPGSAEGHAYTWVDAGVQPGLTYFYRLEDVALSGATTLHDPVSVTLPAPTAVGLASFTAASTTPALAGLAGLGLRRRR